jgi:hypothetical protein
MLVGSLAIVDAVIGLLLAFVVIYVGAVILWSFSPLFAILFVLVALFITIRATAGRSEGL